MKWIRSTRSPSWPLTFESSVLRLGLCIMALWSFWCAFLWWALPLLKPKRLSRTPDSGEERSGDDAKAKNKRLWRWKAVHLPFFRLKLPEFSPELYNSTVGRWFETFRLYARPECFLLTASASVWSVRAWHTGMKLEERINLSKDFLFMNLEKIKGLSRKEHNITGTEETKAM